MLMMTLLLISCRPDGPGLDSQDVVGPVDSGTAADTGTHPAAPAVRLTGDRPVNLLVISIDTLRRDHLGFHSGLDTTPTLDGLMAEGVVLDDHTVCANWTFPSVLCHQTGRTSVDAGLHPEMGSAVEPMDNVWRTLDSLLDDVGYRSGLVSANPYFQPSFGLGSAFDLVDVRGQSTAGEALPIALGQILEHLSAGEPWYQHVHLLDPHTPYNAAVEYERDSTGMAVSPFDLHSSEGFDDLRRGWDAASVADQDLTLAWIELLYNAELRYVDAQLKAFLAQLSTLGALDDTLVLFWSDHGEQFFEDQGLGHGLDLHDEETDGFAFFWMADGGLDARVHREPTASIDLAPTVFDLLGHPQPEQFLGDVIGLAAGDRGVISTLWDNREPAMALRSGDDRLVYRWDGTLELYDRGTDPGEEHDLAGEKPRLMEKLWSELSPEVDKLQAVYPEPRKVDPMR